MRLAERLAFVATACAVLILAGADDPSQPVIEVEAGPIERVRTPVLLRWSGAEPPGASLVLEPLDEPGAEPVPAQWVPGETASLAWIVRDLPAGTSRRYRLVSGRKEAPEDAVTCEDDGKDLVLSVDGRPVLRYHHEVVEAPAGLPEFYRRSGYIHPLTTPGGRAVTDDFAPDHAHQHGLFFAWVNTTFDGHHVDFWNQHEHTGRVRHVEVLSTISGPVFAQFVVKLSHEDITRPDNPVAVLDEIWTIRAYRVEGRHLLDFESVQTCAGEKPLQINQYHYGGLGVRGNRAWFDPGVQGEEPPDPARSGQSDFLTSEGKGRANGNHTRPRWVDLSGLVDGQFAGLTVLESPQDEHFPQPVRLHPNKPYFSIAPEVLGAFTIEPGQPYVSRYRIDVHDGPPDPSTIERLWRDYAEPPRVRLVED